MAVYVRRRFCFLCIAAATAVLTMQAGAQQCTDNFKDTVTTGGSRKGKSAEIETRLIPSMRFTCSGTIVGFTVAGEPTKKGAQDPKIQVWREIEAKCGSYRRPVPEIVINMTTCSSLAQLESKASPQVFHCTLNKSSRVPVQYGDVLGIELPPISDAHFELYFTGNPGSVNYIFQQQLPSVVDTANKLSVVEECPQIKLDIISDFQCSSRYQVPTSAGTRGGNRTTIVTRLIPELKFTCDGIITQFTVRGVQTPGLELQVPRIQIWSESSNQCDRYFKRDSDIAINEEVCKGGGTFNIVGATSDVVFQCTLKTNFRVRVQAGDILGLEFPPTDNESFAVHFTNAGPTNFVFHSQLSIAFLSNSDSEIQEQPQINITVEAEFEDASGAASSVSVPAAVGGAIAGCVTLVILITVTIVIFTVWKRNKTWNIAGAASGTTHTTKHPIANPIFTDGKLSFDYEDIDEKEPKQDLNFEAAAFTAVPPPVNSNTQDYETPVPILSTDTGEDYSTPISKDHVATQDGAYWKPAKNVNELYKQLSASNYRDIQPSQIQIIKVLGSGQFGTVNKGIWQSPAGAMDVAVKQLQPGASEEEKVKFLQEAAINGQFRHPNVVKLMGVVTGEGPTMIVLEHLSNGDLLNFLINHRPSSGEAASTGTQQMLLRFCQHIASGMSYLASKSFIHRDLAARNILVSEDKICKISDFGMSRDVMDENFYVSKGGKVPVKWTAPEALYYKKYSTASDVWSFGCVMYEIWSLGHKPFELFSNEETLRRVAKGFCLPPPPGLTKELYKVMIQCWQPDSSSRPTFPQLVEMLSRADFELFAWEEEDIKDSNPQVKLIGAPMELAQDLYPELQRSYTE